MLIDDLRAFARDPSGYPAGAAAHLCSDAADALKKEIGNWQRRNRDACAAEAELSDAVKLLHDLLGLVPGSGEAAFAFVERHMLGVVSSPSEGRK